MSLPDDVLENVLKGAVMVFMVLLVCILSLMPFTAQACGTHTCGDPEPEIQYRVVHHDSTATYVQGAVGAVLLGCGGYALVRGFSDSRWHWPYEWCLGMVPRRAVVFNPPVAPDPPPGSIKFKFRGVSYAD